MEEQHPSNGYHHLPKAPHSAFGYTNSFPSHLRQNFALSEVPSLPYTIFSTATSLGIKQPSLNLPVNFSSSTFPTVSNNSIFATTTDYGLPTNFMSKPYSSNLMGSYTCTNFPPHPSTTVMLPHPSTTQPIHLLTSTIQLLGTTQTGPANILGPLTTISSITYPITNVTTIVTPSVTCGLVTTTGPLMSYSVPLTSVSALASITYPLTSVTDTLTTSISTSTSLTTAACLTTSAIPLVTSPTYPLTTTSNQASFSSHIPTCQSHSGSIIVTNSSYSMGAQPTTMIQEDSLTKDAANYSDTSESTEDERESPKSTKEGTLAAVLALRDQYSPGLSSSITMAAQQPPMVSLDHLWSSRGNPAVEKELKTEQVDEVDTNEMITHHSDKPIVTITTTSSIQVGPSSPPAVTADITTSIQSLHHSDEPVITTTTTSNMEVRSPSPPTVTIDATMPTQSLDNTMGKYLQLLQQKQQAEDNSPPTATHSTYKEEVCDWSSK